MAKKNGIGDVLAATLGDVSNSDTAGREQIEYIPRTALVADEKNFYSIEGVEELAANIELIGLQQPLRVRPIEGGDGLYRVVSGHRRRAALDKLALDSNRGFEQVPCIVERDDVSPAMQELRLIYANSSTRDMTDADLAKQA
ncbi:MAG: ParB N-terminal domain-containing protein, partial [Oscillospiraceae bacterium]|nr:ParB N-terminal domain-containing protein [Oscillospiraceae bacterium]